MNDAISALVDERLVQRLNQQLGLTCIGPLRTLWDRRAVVQIEIVTPSKQLSWHVDGWEPQLTLQASPHPDPDYIFRYVASQIYAFMQEEGTELPHCFAYRRHPSSRESTRPFRFSALDPARLHGVDLYHVVDETYEWNPLAVLVE